MNNFKVNLTDEFICETVEKMNKLRNEQGIVKVREYESNCVLARKFQEIGIDMRIRPCGVLEGTDKKLSFEARSVMDLFDAFNGGGDFVDPEWVLVGFDANDMPREFMMLDS